MQEIKRKFYLILRGTKIFNIPVIGNDEAVFKFNIDNIELVNGIGSVGSTTLRMKIYNKFKSKGYKFKTVIHKSSVISDRIELSEGSQLLVGTVINAGVK